MEEAQTSEDEHGWESWEPVLQKGSEHDHETANHGKFGVRSEAGRPVGSALLLKIARERQQQCTPEEFLKVKRRGHRVEQPPRQPIHPQPQPLQSASSSSREVQVALPLKMGPNPFQQCIAISAHDALARTEAAVELDPMIKEALYEVGRPVLSFKAMAWKASKSTKMLSLQFKRIADCVFEGGRFLANQLIDAAFRFVDRGSLKPVAWIEKRRYDETPLPVKLRDRSLQSSNKQAKVLQTEAVYGMVFEDTVTAKRMFMKFRLPTPLLSLDRTTAQNIKQAVLKACHWPESGWCKENFPLNYSIVVTDQYAANFSAEHSMDQDWPRCGKVHLPCDVHKLSRAQTTQHNLVDTEISCMVAGSVILHEAGAAQAFRDCVFQVLESNLEIRYAALPEGFVKEYREALRELLLKIPEFSHQDERRKSFKALRIRQRRVIAYFLNGDLQSRRIIHFTENDNVTKETLLPKIRKYLLPALLPGPVPTFPRHRWTNSDLAVDYFAILATHHQLLERASALWLGLDNLDEAPECDDQEGPITWEDLLKKKLQSLPSHVPPLPTPGPAVGEACLDENGPDGDNDQGEQDQVLDNLNPNPPQEQDDGVSYVERDWAKILKSLKQKFIAWIKSSGSQHTVSLAGRLVIMRISMDPVCRLMHKFLHLAGQRWDKEQEFKAALGQTRSYRILEAHKGQDVANLFEYLERAHHSVPTAVPLKDMKLISRNLLFALLSRVACNLQVSLLPSRKACPVRLFSCLLGNNEVEQFYQLRNCLHDSLTAAFVHAFPSVAEASSPTAQDILISLALLIDMDISQIESKHASARRIVMSRSLQTHGTQLDDLSADFLLRQNAVDYTRVFTGGTGRGEGVQTSKRKRLRKVRKVRKDGRERKASRPGGFRTWLHMHKKGILWKTPGTMTELAREFPALPKEEKDAISSIAEAAGTSVDHGYAPFGVKPRDASALAIPLSNTVELAVQEAKQQISSLQAVTREEEARLNTALVRYHERHVDNLPEAFVQVLGRDFHRCVADSLAVFDMHLPADAFYSEAWHVLRQSFDI